ncbi:peroxisome biogenesis factor 1-like [Gigantopelta aegis]|uniref:peroxisome biogenesis factor 1-like n=1 Tax=Gigantopelta aegis TaxID=1735272 RepID=UPI001B88D42A|nr:peroxisome biogenesis factor 1-like [Gigantopelta aegis]
MAAMNSVVVAVEYCGAKHCFLSIAHPAVKYSNDENEVRVFRAEFSDDRQAFFSLSNDLSGRSSHNENTGQLSGLYAEKLGISEGEEILLSPVKGILAADRVDIEPVSVDDWEILERHAAYVESHLLDQIRVVWTDQVVPVWVEKSVCIFLKIVGTEPTGSCLILANETEIVVSAKIRNHADFTRNESWGSSDKEASAEKLTKGQKARRPKYRSLPFPKSANEDEERRLPDFSDKNSTQSDSVVTKKMRPSIYRQSSLLGKMWTYVSAWLPLANEIPHTVDEVSSFDEQECFVIDRYNLVFRVQAMKFSCNPEDFSDKSVLKNIPRGLRKSRYGKKYGLKTSRILTDSDTSSEDGDFAASTTPELFQSTTVYVAVNDVLKQVETNFVQGYIPRVFYAQLRKLLSPNEIARQESGTADIKRSKSIGSSDDKKTNSAKNGRQKSDATGEVKSEMCCVVRVVAVDTKGPLADSRWPHCILRLFDEQPILSGHIIVPDLLRRQMKLDVTGKVWLQTVQCEPDDSKAIELFPLSVVPRKVNNNMISLAFRTWIRQCADEDHPLVLFQGILIKFMIFPGLHVEAQLMFTPSSETHSHQPYILLHEGNVDDVAVSIHKDVSKNELSLISPLLPYRQVSDIDPMVPVTEISSLGGIDEISQQALQHLDTCLGSTPLSRVIFPSDPGLHNGMLLITGPKGCGKTSFGRALCRRLAELPTIAHTVVVDCKPLRGKRVDNIVKNLEALFDEAAWRQPTVIFLDDLDVIASAPTGPETEMSGEALYAAKVAEVIKNLVRFEIHNDSRIALIASSQSPATLHANLMTSRGSHLIQEIVTITPPNKDQRKSILMSVIKNKSHISNDCLNDLDLELISRGTEGFVSRDIEHLVNKAIHAKFLGASSMSSPEQILLSQRDFDVALEGFKPASIRNLSLHQAGELTWDDIGGLTSVKKTLVETLQWPTKYPQLFAACPIRTQSGILLYGAPGTGKTLLAGVVAKECGLNFISIKGPELLSKYIGASEQAVRDLFFRAQSAKPCILFFDEFDSLAPRRGHDSTGVTDRVVNQLLTQLDGIESLTGVYILAATSRPDLIDPALLRPGRLDKSLHCGLPTKSERLSILKSLTRKMYLCDDVNLQKLADECENFTGADFKALLYNAQLKAIHEHTDINYFEKRATLTRGDNSSNTTEEPTEKGHTTDVSTVEGDNHVKLVTKPSFKDTVVFEFPPQKVKVLSPIEEKDSIEKSVVKAVGKVPGKMKNHLDSKLSMGVRKQTVVQRVTIIPNLETGPMCLTQDQEEKVITMIDEIYRRENVKTLSSDLHRQTSEPDTERHLIEVNQSHLLKALAGLRPSVSAEERDRYKYIYEHFMSSRHADFSPDLASEMKRATLA